MTSTIHSFLSNKDHSQILIVKDKKVAIVKKADVNKFTLLRAKLGFGGKASVKSVSNWVKKNSDEMDSGTHARFNRYTKTYNEGKVFWKRGKTVTPAPLSKEDYSKKNPVDYQAEALFIEILSQVKKKPADDELDPLIETINQLGKAILWLDPIDKKRNKELFIQILKMKAEMKHRWSNNPELKESLKDLQTSVLRMHFYKRLNQMDTALTQLEMRFELHEDALDPHSDFIKNQLVEWRSQLNKGKLISIPKWFHCTKTSDLVTIIADSRIKYLHKGAYAGAFVSNRPETGYGSFGVAMSDNIEKTATRRKNKPPKLPKQSQFNGDIRYGEVNDNDSPALINKQEATWVWLGFQKKSGICLKKRKIEKRPLNYYKDNTVSYIFHYNANQSAIDQLEAFGKKRKIKVVSYEELNALRTLINTTYELSLPERWEGNIKRCKNWWQF